MALNDSKEILAMIDTIEILAMNDSIEILAINAKVTTAELPLFTPPWNILPPFPS